MSRRRASGEGAILVGLFRPGTTLLHRLPAGAKLLGLLAAGILVGYLRGPWSAIGFAVTATLVLWWAAGSLRILRSLRGLMVMLAVLGVWQTWQSGWPRAVESVGDLLALMLLATAVTTSTPVDAMVDALVRVLTPFRRIGVNPEAVALAFSLMLRAIPATVEIAQETRDAAWARGLDRSLRARLTPLVVRVVARARLTGEALQARGLADD